MFKVGKTYMFRIITDGVEGTRHGTVEAWEPPLLKLEDFEIPEAFRARAPGGKYAETGILRGEIINVTSPNFISAVEDNRHDPE